MAIVREVTISNGANTSGSEVNKNYELTSIIFNDTSYANTSYEIQGEFLGTWRDLYDVFGSQVSITVTEGGKFALPADAFKDVNKVRVTGSSNESADKTFQLVFSEI